MTESERNEKIHTGREVTRERSRDAINYGGDHNEGGGDLEVKVKLSQAKEFRDWFEEKKQAQQQTRNTKRT